MLYGVSYITSTDVVSRMDSKGHIPDGKKRKVFSQDACLVHR